MGADSRYSQLGENDFKEEDPLDDSSTPPPKPRFLTAASKKKPWIITLLVLAAAGAAVLIALGAIHQSSSTEVAAPSPTASKSAAAELSTAAPSSTTSALSSSSAASSTTPDYPEETTSKFDLGNQILDCGGNFVQAREKGCIYDVMMQLWIPEPCLDLTLSERFLADGNWTWWADPEATEVISDERIALGEHEVTYVEADYHATHCMYAWELLVRGLRTQKPIIEPLISYDHAVHCRHKALKAHDSHGAIAPTGYTRCAMYHTWKSNLPPNRFSSTD